MKNLKVGHQNNASTGVSVFLFDEIKPMAVHVCGSAPGSREVLALQPDALVGGAHGLMFAGGSAFGLATSQGVMQYQKEQGVGFKTPHSQIPIIPAAIIYDLGYQDDQAPTAEMAYEACQKARENNHDIGSIGAGRGALIGKLIPDAEPSKGGIGYAEISIGDLKVCAYVVVNALGDVVGENGQILAGAKKQGAFQDSAQYCLADRPINKLDNQNTTLVAVFTNARLDQGACKRLARAASAGMARAIKPVFTLYDGDIVFAGSLGDVEADELVVAEAAACVVQEAIYAQAEHACHDEALA